MFSQDDVFSYDEIPELDQYKKDILDFDKIDLTNKNSFEINDLYYSAAKILPMSAFSQPMTGRNFFRVRAKRGIGISEDLESIKTFSYPPREFSPSGRANQKFTSVFYCSDSYITTMYESRMQIDEVGYLGIWKCISVKPVRYGCILPSKLDVRNRWRNHIDSIYLDSLKSGKLHDKSLQEIFLKDYIAEKFITEAMPYCLTSFIAHAALYSNNHIDFLVYPSVQSSKLKCNVAFNPNSVDEHLKLQKVIKFKILEKNNYSINYRIELVGDVVDDKVKWRLSTDDDWNELN